MIHFIHEVWLWGSDLLFVACFLVGLLRIWDLAEAAIRERHDERVRRMHEQRRRYR